MLPRQRAPSEGLTLAIVMPFYGRDWSGASLDEFMKAVDGYLVWFRDRRIKTALGSMTPLEYRQSLGFVI